MNQKKILIFMPSIEGGGVEKNLFLIANYLSKNNTDIMLLTANPEYKNKFDKKIKIISPSNSYNLKKSPRLKKYFFCLLILFKILFKNKNIITFSFQANLYAILISKFFNRKIIIRSNSSPSGWSNNFLKKIIYKIVLKMADKIIVNSIEFKKEMEKKFNIECISIYNPLNKAYVVGKAKKKTILNFYKAKNCLKIITIGRFVDQKDHMTIIKAINLIKEKINPKLIIIGRGIEKKNYKNFIKINNLYKNVKIINFQKNPFKFITKADLFVLSSKFEGLPNVLLEAMALKKLVISTNCPTGPKEILANGKNGVLFKISDYKALSKIFMKIYSNKKKFNKHIINANKDLKKFDFELNCKKYLCTINSLIN